MLPRGAQMRILICVCAALIATSVGVGRGHASERSAVVVIDSGTEDIFIESLVRTNAETELKNQGYVIVAGAEVGGDTPTKLLACAGDLPCSVAALQGISAKVVVFISLRSDAASESKNFRIVVRNYEVSTGKVLARTSRRCPECKEEVDLAAFTAQLIVELLRESNEREVPEDSPPPPPDPDPIESTTTIKPAVTGTIPVPTSTGSAGQSGTGKIDSSSQPLRLVKYVGLGVGVAAIATGTYLVLIDGPVIEDSVRQPEANDTLVPGFVSLGIGVAAVGLSAWLWAREGGDDDASRSRAQLVPTQGGAAFVWSGGF